MTNQSCQLTPPPFSSNQELNPLITTSKQLNFTFNSNGKPIFLNHNEFKEATSIYLSSPSTQQNADVLGRTCTQRKINLPLYYSRRPTNSTGYTRLDVDGTDNQEMGKPDNERIEVPTVGSNNVASLDIGDSQHNELKQAQLPNESYVQASTLLP